MGYSLHITRRKKHWVDESGPVIDLSEWVALVASDPELRFDPELGEHFAVWSGHSALEIPCIAWDSGNLESKHPDQPLVDKMLEVAAALNAHVVGDEEEVHGEAQTVTQPPSPGVLQKAIGWLRALRANLSRPTIVEELPFKVGSRVKGFRARPGTVTNIDLRAGHGLGIVSVRYDDGRLEHTSAVAHGLEAENASQSGIQPCPQETLRQTQAYFATPRRHGE